MHPEKEVLNTVESMAQQRRAVRIAAINNILRAVPSAGFEAPAPLIIPEKLPEGVVGMNMREVENAEIEHGSALEQSRADVEKALENAA
jgi:hypothetical protein